MGSIKEIYRYNGSSWVRLHPVGSDFLTEPSFVGNNSINDGNVFSGVTPTTKGMYATTSANKLAFLPPEQIYIERSTDGGETFEYFPLADALKGRLFDLQTLTSTCTIPTVNGVRDCNAITRITITCNHYNYPETATPETFKDYWTYDNFIEDERYISLNQFYIFLSSVADRVWLKIEVSNLGNPGSWRTVWDTTTNADNLGLSGWSGGNSINFPGVAFGGSLNQQSGALTSNCSFIRFTFRTMTADPEHPFDNAYLSSSSTSSTQTVYFVAGYGLAGWQYSNNMMKLGQIYTWDYQQNVSFPGNIYPSDNASAWNTAVSSIGASSKRFHDIWVSLVHSYQVETDSDIKERGTYLYNKYLGYVNDSNNYPAPALVNKNIITPVSYLRTGTGGILPYTLNASGGGWTNAVCSIGSSDYRFGASYIANMYANVIQASKSIRATQIYENGVPLEDRYLGYFFNTTTEAYKALCTYSNGVQTPIQYLRAGTAGIVPYSLSAASSATDWTKASGQIGTSTYRFYSSYIKAMQGENLVLDGTLTVKGDISERGKKLQDEYVNFASKLLTTNPFGGKNDLYISKIDNAFYCADKRWNVSASLYNESDDSLIEDFTSSEISRLFNGNYEDHIDISQGQYATITVNFDTDEGQLSSGVKCFPGYPYGYFYFSFYDNGAPLSKDGVQVQVYCNFESHGVGWHDLVGYYINGTSGNSQNVIMGYQNPYYSISEVKFTIHGRADSIQVLLTQIEMSLSRPSPYRQPIISKYTAEKLYYPLTAPQFLADSFIEDNVKLSNKYVQLDTVGDRVGFKQSNGNLPSYIICGSSGMIPRTTANSWDTSVCYLGTSSYRFAETWVKQIYSKSMIADVYVKAPTLYEGDSTLSNKYVQLDYSDGNAVAFFNPKGQSPTYIRAGLNGIIPYTKADNWESSSGYVGAPSARFATSYIKDMYADVISADNQVSAVRFIENGTNLSNKYAQKATTLSGYGITDCKIQGQTIQIGSNSIAVPEPSGEVLTTIWTGDALIVGSATSMTSSNVVSITLNDYFQYISKLRFYFINSGTYANYTSFVCDMIIYPNDATPSDYCGMASININNGAWAGFISFAVDPVDTSRNKINLKVFTFKWDTTSGAPASLREFHLTKVDKVN